MWSVIGSRSLLHVRVLVTVDEECGEPAHRVRNGTGTIQMIGGLPRTETTDRDSDTVKVSEIRDAP